MRLFIWQRVDNLTYHYHPEGGLVVVAKDLERARELIKDPRCWVLLT